MIYQAILKIRGKEMPILYYSYRCHIQHCDDPNLRRIIQLHIEACEKIGNQEYLPVEGDLITLMFECSGDEQFFYDWLNEGVMHKGEIHFIYNEVEIADILQFWDCFCLKIEESMSAANSPMVMTVYLSPGIIKRNNLEPREKVWKVSEILHKLNLPVNSIITKKENQINPLVKSVKGPKCVSINQIAKYVVVDYNIATIEKNKRNSVKWIISIDGKRTLQNEQGEILNLFIRKEWMGKEIKVMPYLKSATEKVCQQTLVKKKVIVFFIGGAGDKKSFLGFGPTNIMESVQSLFKSKIKKIENIDCETVYLGYDEIYPENDIKRYVLPYCKTTSIPIYIIGHSFGGWNAAHLSKRLASMGYKINMLITLDPVSGSSGVDYFADLYFESPIPVKAAFWINISAYPKRFAIDDAIAHIGVQWKPWVHAPNIYHKTEESHGSAWNMFIENIYNGKSAFDLLIEDIKNS